MKHEPINIPKLNKYFQERPYAKYYDLQQYREAPQEYWDSLMDLEPSDAEELLAIQDRRKLLDPSFKPIGRKWAFMPDGTATCSGYMDFPGATPEMLYWWFSWMPVDPMRGKMWEPKNHVACSISKEMGDKITDTSIPLWQRQWGVKFFPIDAGATPNPLGEKAPVAIRFHNPEEFGFDLEKIEALGRDYAILCATVGPVGGPEINSFCHVGRKIESGMELISHFWYGYTFENGEPVKSKITLPEIAKKNLGQTQSVHLIEEYYFLSRILADLYHEFKDMPDHWEDYN